jgi:hypothetical protein
MAAFIRRTGQYIARGVPVILLAWAFGCVAFLYGYQVGDRHWFPFAALNDARVAAHIIRFKLQHPDRVRALRQWTNISPDDGKMMRVISEEPVNDDTNFLLSGGPGQYLEYCPDHGCAAVILRRDGSLVHSYPYRPDELVTRRTMSLPYQQIMHDDARDTAVFGLAALPHGDLVVVYDFQQTEPASGGIARIDKDGHVLWYRRDYSDHWPKVTDKGDILVISHVPEARHVGIRLGGGQAISFDCPHGVSGDLVRVLDANGHVTEEIPIFDALRNSPYRSYLIASVNTEAAEKDGCDPIHANMVSPVGAELAARIAGVQADDLLVSMRNISAIGIIGRSDHRLKRLFKGAFLLQHSAQAAPGGKIIVFDNLGASPKGGPSRVLLIDPATGKADSIFPNAAAEGAETFSVLSGNINLSADGSRALVAISTMGRAYEIRLADGVILTSFDNLQDLRSLPQFAQRTTMARFHQNGVYYVPPNLLD